MRRTIGGVVLLGALGLGLTACGGSSKPSTSSVPSSTPSSVTSSSAPAAAASSACTKIEKTVGKLQPQLTKLESKPSQLAKAIATDVAQLKTESASASPAVKSKVNAFAAQLEAAAHGKVNIPKMTADAKAIAKACSA